MKKADIRIGNTYRAKVSDKITVIRIDAKIPISGGGGWNATNLATKKKVRIKSAQRLRSEVKKRDVSKPLSDKQAEKKRREAIKEIDQRLDEQTTATGGPTSPRRGKKKSKAASGTTKPQAATRAKRGDDAKTPKRRGVLDIAAEILAKAKKPMGCKQIVEHALKAGLWKTTGKTPHATLYAAIIREIAKKGDDARFEKVDRGQFQARKGA
ncbi:MAG: winged helix-turn-helix domain-containing protein [Phycisphaerales bacterium]|nr:winged helix-turn-helix domain-containing protein [Phycisphaerales bacterium]